MHLTNGFKVRRQREILLVIVPQNPENSSGEISILAKILYFLFFFFHSFNGPGITLPLKADVLSLTQALTFV